MIIPTFEAQTEWIEPEEYPDLRSYDEIAIDLETRDPELKTRGSGSVIGLGEVIGIAVAVPGRKFYFPIAHGSGPNMDKNKPGGKLNPTFVEFLMGFPIDWTKTEQIELKPLGTRSSHKLREN